MTQQIKAKSRKWTEEEDGKLNQHVEKHGVWKWKIAGQDIGRSESSCRQRWHDHLAPGLNPGKLTDKEKRKIQRLHSELGNKWAEIARYVPGRTANDVKNFCNKGLSKKLRPVAPPGAVEEFSSAVAPPPDAFPAAFEEYNYNPNLDFPWWEGLQFGNHCGPSDTPNIDGSADCLHEFWYNPHYLP